MVLSPSPANSLPAAAHERKPKPGLPEFLLPDRHLPVSAMLDKNRSHNGPLHRQSTTTTRLPAWADYLGATPRKTWHRPRASARRGSVCLRIRVPDVSEPRLAPPKVVLGVRIVMHFLFICLMQLISIRITEECGSDRDAALRHWNNRPVQTADIRPEIDSPPSLMRTWWESLDCGLIGVRKARSKPAVFQMRNKILLDKRFRT